MGSQIAKSVGERIKNYRKQQGLSQEDLAFRAGLHPTYVGQLERGEKNCTIESIEKVSVALGVTLEELFRFIQPDFDVDEEQPLSKILNLLQSRKKGDLIDMLNVIEAMTKWKDSDNNAQK